LIFFTPLKFAFDLPGNTQGTVPNAIKPLLIANAVLQALAPAGWKFAGKRVSRNWTTRDGGPAAIARSGSPTTTPSTRKWRLVLLQQMGYKADIASNAWRSFRLWSASPMTSFLWMCRCGMDGLEATAKFGFDSRKFPSGPTSTSRS